MPDRPDKLTAISVNGDRSAPGAQDGRHGSVGVLLGVPDALVRLGIRTLVGEAPGLDVVEDVGDAPSLHRHLEGSVPDVCVLDRDLVDGYDGLTGLVESVLRACPGCAVLVLVADPDGAEVVGSLEAGAAGVMSRQDVDADLVTAVRAAAGNLSVLTEAPKRMVLGEVAPRPADEVSRAVPRMEDLTRRERETLGHLAAGLSNADIAERLVVGGATVKTHVASIMSKLGVSTRAQAVVVAYEGGLARPRAGQAGRGAPPP